MKIHNFVAVNEHVLSFKKLYELFFQCLKLTEGGILTLSQTDALAYVWGLVSSLAIIYYDAVFHVINSPGLQFYCLLNKH